MVDVFKLDHHRVLVSDGKHSNSHKMKTKIFQNLLMFPFKVIRFNSKVDISVEGIDIEMVIF